MVNLEYFRTKKREDLDTVYLFKAFHSWKSNIIHALILSEYRTCKNAYGGLKHRSNADSGDLRQVSA